ETPGALTSNPINNKIYCGNYNGSSLSVIACSPFSYICGDCNGNGEINIADVVWLINYLFINGPSPVPWQAGDVNADGKVDASDVVYLINYLFINGPPPCGGRQ
ncbi:MAG: dockerin type I repeat-containing protein, partial [candidate division Zixibacteria bacterium]|nr:dockerin type I repeat-containing protein [candidate division Zixibacteria bacterium]